jgi:ABC-2 type transport system permease protein
MKRILSQCVKELAQFSRDRLTLGLAFILPMMTLLIFGFAIRLEAKNIPLLVQDFDRSVLSQEYSDRLFATNLFISCGEACREIITTQSNPEVALDRSFVKVIVIIPPDFSRKIKADKPTEIQAIVDGTDTNNARVIRNNIKATT